VSAETSVAPATTAGAYAPRSAWFDSVIDCGPAAIKLSVISADGLAPEPKTFAAARKVIAAETASLEATPHIGAGFAILHRGEEANWLLLLWWTDGGTAMRKLWRGELGHGTTFAPVDPLYMACVWELGIIDFERKAWMETAMSGRPLSDYLARTLPRGTV
jgi:hypothetical protein